MINSKILLYQPVQVGGDYDVTIYFANSSLAAYLRIGDEITDTASNRYKIINATLPFSDGGTVKVHFITNDVIPVEDTDYVSTINSPDTFDPLPRLRTTGILYGVSTYDLTNYEYSLSLSPDDGSVALKAVVGDKILDSSGKEFEITYLDEANKFAVPFRVKEVELVGMSPTEGFATLYSSTVYFNFYQGTEFTPEALTKIHDRDFKKLDILLVSNINLFDSISTSLPTGTGVTIDGVPVVDGMLVTFNNLSTGNNFRTYKVSGVGTSLVWNDITNSDPVKNSKIHVLSGTAYNSLDLIFSGKWELADRNIFIAIAGENLVEADPVYVSAGYLTIGGGDTVDRDFGKVYKYEMDNSVRNNLVGIATKSVNSNDLIRVRTSGIHKSSINLFYNQGPSDPRWIQSPIWAYNSTLVYGSKKPPFYSNITSNYTGPMESYVGSLISMDEIAVNIVNTPSYLQQFISVALADTNTVLFSPAYNNLSSVDYSYTVMMTSPTGPVVNRGSILIVKEGTNYTANCTYVGSDIGFKLDVDPVSGDVVYLAPTATISTVSMLRVERNDNENI